MKLRPYQEEVVGQIELQWALDNPVVIAELPTGAGKTAILSRVIDDHNGFVVAIAHRDKLVEQMSLMLGRAGVRHDIIASDKTKRLIAKKHVKRLGQCFYVPGARCRVASIDTLVRAKGLEQWAAQVTLWIIDECFPAGTLVDGRPIETLHVGDTVTAFNEETGAFESRRITRLFKNNAPKHMARIALSEHHVIHCTYGHPFWTKRGWIEACLLTEQDEVLLHDVSARSDLHPMQRPGGQIDRKPPLSMAEDRPGFLFDQMRDDLSGGKSRPKRAGGNRNNGLHDVWGRNDRHRLDPPASARHGARILQPGLFQPLPERAFFGNNGSNQPKVCVGAHDCPQSDGPARCPGESKPITPGSRPSAAGARGEWTRTPFGRIDALGDRGGPRVHGASRDPDETAEGFGLSDVLQSGRGECPSENSDRSGRGFSQCVDPTSAGSEEGRPSGWARLESVALYERGDSRFAGECLDDGFVYNIEVEGLHTYVANGVTVHNCHHVLRANKWGKGVALFSHPACRGLGLTATPGRPDGQGLGRHADGFADAMVHGPSMRWLIDEGYLCDYDVVCPPTDLVTAEAPRGSDGEYTHAQRQAAERQSHIVGDVPEHYLRFARGLSGITFCGTIETATATAEAYRARGVTAEMITGNTDSNVRDDIFDRAERGELNQIVAVDVISEGVDIPALQVGSFARLTGSIVTWRQQLGRLLRPIYAPGYDLETREGRLASIAASRKPRALLIDHVGGFIDPALGPPDRPRDWSLDRREKRAKADKSDEIPLRVCSNPKVDCFHPYPRIYGACPKCGYAPEPASRAAPEHVDGDLQLLTPEALALLQGRALDLDMTREQHDAQQLAKGAQSAWLGKHWRAYEGRRDAIVSLRESMDQWAGSLHASGRTDSEIQRTFYLRFGVDVLTAQGLDAVEALELKERIDDTVNRGRA